MHGPNWQWWEYRSTTGALHIVEFDAELARAPERGFLPHSVRIFIKAAETDGEQIPSPRAHYSALGDTLVAALEKAAVEFLLVGALWHEGYLDMVFQTSNKTLFGRSAAAWARAQPGVEVVPEPVDDGIRFFREELCPGEEGREQILNRSFLETIRKVSDLSVDHFVEFELEGPGGELEQMESEMCRKDFTRVGRTANELVIGRTMRLEAIEVAEWTARIRRYATSRGARLLGWSTTPKGSGQRLGGHD